VHLRRCSRTRSGSCGARSKCGIREHSCADEKTACAFRAATADNFCIWPRAGVTVLALSPGDFGKFIGEEIEKWAKVVKFSGIKAD